MTPLVSVMTPCYNSARTLPLALASLAAQEYENWECLLVDDGSTDDPREVVERANDARIRYFRLDRNYGRGVARQAALDRAQGDHLCMLDADDWMYPSRISRQIEVMEGEPRLALVSAGVAIVDERNEIVGVRGCGQAGRGPVIQGPFSNLAPPPVAHASSMIRMSTAREAGYDPRLLLAQDIDFLLQVLLDRCYCVLPVVAYAYMEHASVTSEKILRAHHYVRRIFAKHKDRFPLASRLNILKSLVKSALYRTAFAMGLRKSIIMRRSRKPTSGEATEFRRARGTVLAAADRMFGRSLA